MYSSFSEKRESFAQRVIQSGWFVHFESGSGRCLWCSSRSGRQGLAHVLSDRLLSVPCAVPMQSALGHSVSHSHCHTNCTSLTARYLQYLLVLGPFWEHSCHRTLIGNRLKKINGRKSSRYRLVIAKYFRLYNNVVNL